MYFATAVRGFVLAGIVAAVACGGSAAAQAMFWGAVSVSAAPAQFANAARIVVTITNTSRQEQSFDAGPMCVLTDLIVTDERGKVLTPGSKCVAPSGAPVRESLKSNELYGGPGYRDQPRKGEPLADWGYALTPGTYTISAVPSASLWSDRSFKPPSAAANAITITLR